jgi:hypothetical protein
MRNLVLCIVLCCCEISSNSSIHDIIWSLATNWCPKKLLYFCEVGMYKCGICSTLLDFEDKYCYYCGYRFKTFKTYLSYEIDYFMGRMENDGIPLEDITKKHPSGKKKRFKDSPVYSIQRLSERIDKERDRLYAIDVALKNIVNEEMLKRINNIKRKMTDLVDSLYICNLSLQFIKISTGLKTIIKNIGKYSVSVVENHLDELSEEYDKWIADINQNDNSKAINEFLNQNRDSFITLRERIGLKIAEDTLKTTSLIADEDINVEEIDKGIGGNYQKIIYEIDRLEGELELEQFKS